MANTWHDITKYYISRTTKKDVYVCFTVFLFFFLLSTLIYDAVWIYKAEHPEYTSQNFTNAIMFLHIIGLYVGIMGFVYIRESHRRLTKMAVIALVAIGAHVLLFIMRISYEIVGIQYRQEGYQT